MPPQPPPRLTPPKVRSTNKKLTRQPISNNISPLRAARAANRVRKRSASTISQNSNSQDDVYINL